MEDFPDTDYIQSDSFMKKSESTLIILFSMPKIRVTTISVKEDSGFHSFAHRSKPGNLLYNII